MAHNALRSMPAQPPFTHIAVVGAGRWGSALSIFLADRGCAVTLWAFEEEVARCIEQDRANPFLPGYAFPAGIRATWSEVSWKATTPPNTSLTVRVRSGDTDTTLGAWFGPYQQSPAKFGKGSPDPLVPNPAFLLQVEFTLKSVDQEDTPILHDFQVSYSCMQEPG